MIALDTETTGVDLRHGAKPFIVSTCDKAGHVTVWEADVNPLTREPAWADEDLDEIRAVIRSADLLVLQNPKFDVAALASIGLTDWDWSKVRDTLLAGHLLASNEPHDLTSMVAKYLGRDIEGHEKGLEKAVKSARTFCRNWCPDWRIAKKDDPTMPSAGEEPWRFDYWLPRAVWKYRPRKGDHKFDVRHEYPEWESVCRTYAGVDAAATLPLWIVQERYLRERGLDRIYAERLKLLPIIYEMESRGVTISGERLDELDATYRKESDDCELTCINLARDSGYELEMPRGASINGSLKNLLWHHWKCPVVKRTDGKKTKGGGGNPSLDREAIEEYKRILPPRSPRKAFVEALSDKRARDMALTYIGGYRRFWKPHGASGAWYVMHPSINPTGTDTLRFSSKNPNEQNISKREGFNLRYAFGPAPGREWWSADAQNLELRIPAFEAEEPLLMEVFLNPDQPPYYGSYHLAVFDVLHPELFKRHGKACKTLYESTYYQWVKNGNFAVIYGAGEETADKTYRVPGAYRLIRERFPRIARLNDKQVEYANRHGYVETIPDRSVDPDRGYPILCSRTAWGRVKPTVPLNYHIQGTAMQWSARAMVRTQEQLVEWRREGFDGYIVLQVHDEQVFDLPRAAHPLEDPKRSNLGRMRVLQRLMERGGDDIGVPTPVGLEYHKDNWSEGVAV